MSKKEWYLVGIEEGMKGIAPCFPYPKYSNFDGSSENYRSFIDGHIKAREITAAAKAAA